jgi:hypothetical protein
MARSASATSCPTASARSIRSRQTIGIIARLEREGQLTYSSDAVRERAERERPPGMTSMRR